MIIDFITFILYTIFDFLCKFAKRNLIAKASEDRNHRLA